MCTYHRIYDRSNCRGTWNPIIISLPSCVLGYMNFERCFPSTMGMKPFLEKFILNPFSIFSMYVDCERPSNPLDLSH